MFQAKVSKTDKRHTGKEVFGYVCAVQPGKVLKLSERYALFNEIRDWCIQTWGNSCERDHYLAMYNAGMYDRINEHWSWHTEYYETKLYFRTDKQANWFKLRWS